MSGALTTITRPQFDLLCEVIGAVARNSGLKFDEAQDFSQTVHLKLLERNYAPLALYAGRCRLRTYFGVVVKRLLLDWRNARMGKWRPSKCAVRLGARAVDLDRLMSRDGYGIDEAVGILSQQPDSPPPQVLRKIGAVLPRRCRVRMAPLDAIEGRCGRPFVDVVEAVEARASKLRALRMLRHAYRELEPADRQLLALRYGRNLPIVDIARLLEVPAKPLYRRIEAVVGRLRRSLSIECAIEQAERATTRGTSRRQPLVN